LLHGHDFAATRHGTAITQALAAHKCNPLHGEFRAVAGDYATVMASPGADVGDSLDYAAVAPGEAITVA
jgi:hypothetical protein